MTKYDHLDQHTLKNIRRYDILWQGLTRWVELRVLYLLPNKLMKNIWFYIALKLQSDFKPYEENRDPAPAFI